MSATGAQHGSPHGGVPPGPAWRALHDSGAGHLSVFFSDPLARWPVRHITRPADNKCDPNLETGTYGLFSTCQPRLRVQAVRDGSATIFFLATPRPGQGRVVAGYYHLGWYAEGSQGSRNADFAVAADSMRFVEPIAVTSIPGTLGQYCATPFRQTRPLTPQMTGELRAMVDAQEDLTGRYLQEVDRLERFAQAQTGLRYPSMGRSRAFSWQEAADYLGGEDIGKVANTSSSGLWRCADCDHVITNTALLKRCPVCQAVGSLRPEAE